MALVRCESSGRTVSPVKTSKRDPLKNILCFEMLKGAPPFFLPGPPFL